MPKNSAEYQREYRARKKLAVEETEKPLVAARLNPLVGDPRIAELEEEVRHLKQLLAGRDVSRETLAHPFGRSYAVPKPGSKQ